MPNAIVAAVFLVAVTKEAQSTEVDASPCFPPLMLDGQSHCQKRRLNQLLD